jgi:serine protease Do
VIGVDSAIYTPSGGNVGVGFAIPSSLAQPVIEQLRRTGHVRRGFLGVQLQSVTPELARILTLDAPRGALVSEVAANGPAAAKLARGDVILAVAGQPVPTVHDLQRIVANLPIDQLANLVIWRDRREMPLEILIGQQPDEQRVAARPDTSHATEPAAGPPGSLGLTLAFLTPELRRERALGKTTEGVVVTKVQRDSPAEARGLHPGDVIVAVDGTRVMLPEDVTQHLQRAGAERRKSVLVLLERDGVQQFLALPAATG